ncbi:hypothetical protein [Granulosicoccus antarcticus]|uniref:Uncharacterized protein n=1 Tax=Granulosicoccus antarcticus IMCC3135 TaxID=1192854 RepID=A0A2Z2NNV7_9GAMM|nr:hypothetical protein [Granulosicoccus antarcticus]ASJ70520.1 hypothetical protein IMCC3135_02030 [Granulosicoccus antarcticus IMCC3135]
MQNRGCIPASVINLIVILILGSLIISGLSISTHTWAQRTTVLYLPVGFLYASMPVGMLLSLTFHLFNSYLEITHPPGSLTTQGDDNNDSPSVSIAP